MPKVIFFIILICFSNTILLGQQKKQLLGDTVAIQPRSSWGAQPAKTYKKHQPVRITIHHEGGRVLTENDDAKKRLKNIQTWCMGPERNWTDIPYHYLIAPDGTVYEGRNVLTVGETNTDYDPTGHLLISFLGNYDEQELNDSLVNTLTDLIAYFCIKYDIDPATIASHRDYCGHTGCPGKNIYPYIESKTIVNSVKAKLL